MPAAEKICREIRCGLLPGCSGGPKGPGGKGEPHLITLDKVHYDFQGVGEFVMARSDNSL